MVLTREPAESCSFPFLRFRVSICRQSSAAQSWHGSAPSLTASRLRRVLGKVLIDRFCPYGGEVRCQPQKREGSQPDLKALCRLAESCPYGVLFAASMSRRPPFALYVPKTIQAARCTFVELTVLGSAWRFYPWLLRCLARALREGLGFHREQWEVREIHRLDERRRSERICGGDLDRLPAALEPELLQLELESDLSRPVAVDLLSPTRLLHRGRLQRQHAGVPLALLVDRILDRAADLYGAGSSEFFEPRVRTRLEAEASRVPLLEDATRWLEARDYSARSRCELPLGGKVGRLVYGLGASRFLPILRFGEIVHVGKNTASGCGRLRADLTDPTHLNTNVC